MHWGRQDGEGSEHLIDGRASELEIHFVHTKQNAPSSDQSYYAVIAVMAEVDYVEGCGPWKQLSPEIVSQYEDTVFIDQFRFDSLLPENLDYYYYEGSLTTPPCTERVLWFVLKNKIQVPASYLAALRQVKDENNNNIQLNFRYSQDVGQRIVSTPFCHEEEVEE